MLGGYLHVAFGWRSVFYVLAGFGALFLAGAIALVRETNVRRDASALTPGRLAENLRTLLGSSAYLGYVAAVSLMFCGQFAFISGSSFVLIGGLGVAPDVYGFCFGAVAVGLMVGSFTSSRLTARAGIDRMVLTGTALGATSGLAMAALAWGGAPSVPAIIAPMFGFALGLGLVGPNAVAGAVGPFPHMAGLASAVLGVAQMTGSAVYGIAVRHVSDGTARPMSAAIASAGIVALLAFVFARSRVAAASAPGP